MQCKAKHRSKRRHIMPTGKLARLTASGAQRSNAHAQPVFQRFPYSTLPGFINPIGSNVRLIARIISISTALL